MLGSVEQKQSHRAPRWSFFRLHTFLTTTLEPWKQTNSKHPTISLQCHEALTSPHEMTLFGWLEGFFPMFSDSKHQVFQKTSFFLPKNHWIRFFTSLFHIRLLNNSEFQPTGCWDPYRQSLEYRSHDPWRPGNESATKNGLPGIWPLVVCFYIYIIYLLSYLYYRRTNIHIYIYIIDCPSNSNLQKEREFCYIWFLGAKTSVIKQTPQNFVMFCATRSKRIISRKVMRNHIETSDVNALLLHDLCVTLPSFLGPPKENRWKRQVHPVSWNLTQTNPMSFHLPPLALLCLTHRVQVRCLLVQIVQCPPTHPCYTAGRAVFNAWLDMAVSQGATNGSSQRWKVSQWECPATSWDATRKFRRTFFTLHSLHV